MAIQKKKISVGEADLIIDGHIVKILPRCEGSVILKYLNRKGQYRFYSFTKFIEVRDKPKQIGTTNKLITNILTAQSDKSNIGYKNERTITLTTKVDNEQLFTISDIYTIPRVYALIGDGDEPQDWIEVTIKANGNLVIPKKDRITKLTIDVLLPEFYTIRNFN